MTRLHTYFRWIVAAMMLALVTAVAVPASAQQGEVTEQQLLNALHGNALSGRVTIPDQKAATLIQPAGQAWRNFHQGTLLWIGGIAILGMLLVLLVYYLWHGTIRIEGGRSGRTILRFNAIDRFVHWLTASTFVILGITGLNITFGRSLLLPLIGPDAFSAWSEWGKYAHNYLSFAFTIGVVLMLLIWISKNFPRRVDIEWLKRGGGMFGHDHPPAYKFNAGQKLLFWIVLVASAVMIVSGYALMFPFYGTTMDQMQNAQIFHAVVAMLFIALMLAHIYLGTLGMEGAFEAMVDGNVDVNWAKEHHSLWAEQELGPGAGRSAPAGAHATPAE